MLVLRSGSWYYKVGMFLNITENAFMPVTSIEFVTLQRNACRDNTCSPWWDSYLEWLQLGIFGVFFFFFCYAVLKEESDMTWATELNWLKEGQGGEVGFYCCFRHLVLSNAFETPWTEASQVPSVHGISQARILEWVAISFSKGSSQPRDWSCA